MSKIKLIIGDYSGDGHGKSKDCLIESNFTLVSLEKSYKAGTKKVGFDLIKSIAEDYEDNKISMKHLSKLKELGFDGLFDEEFCKDENPSLEVEEYIDIFLFICKLGNKKFEYKFMNEDSDTWNIGGYGLFY